MLHSNYTVPYGNAIDLKNTARQLATPDRDRLTLPVCSAVLCSHDPEAAARGVVSI